MILLQIFLNLVHGTPDSIKVFSEDKLKQYMKNKRV